QFVAGKCPLAPVSSSASTLVHRSSSGGLIEAAQSTGGLTVNFLVGVGTVPLGGGQPDMTCDPDHACQLVAKLQLVSCTQFWAVPITFANADPIAGCGGSAAGAINTGGSDQLSDAWSNWTVQACRQPGATGAPTRASFIGEGEAVQSFVTGDLDLAYTAAGY